MAKRKSRAKGPPRKKRTKRDYKLEYALRKQKAELLGYSLDIARGHAPKGVLSVKQAKSLSRKDGTRIILPGTRVEDVPTESITTDRPSISPTLKTQIEDVLDTVYGIDIRNLHGMEDEETLMRYLLDEGFTAREAYDLRFSPKG